MDASVLSDRLVGVICLLVVSPVIGRAEEPKTLWTFLGIPQACHTIQGALANRSGKHPGLEKKPPLKGLSDPANLASDVPVLKKAAEVKVAEDLKKQKIKAIRYLTEIGCGCYDTDGSITEAILAVSDDCTEEVRLATVQAIGDAASRACCSNCGETCCCNKKVLLRLAEMAYERDDTGCFREPSSRVREAAAVAFRACCPDAGPVVMEQPAEQPTPGVPREAVEESPAQEEIEQDEPPMPPEAGASRRPPTTPQFTRASVSDASDDSPRLPVAADTTFQGVILHADAKHRLAHVHLEPRPSEPPRRCLWGLASQCTAAAEGTQYQGLMVVVQAFPGSANVRPLDKTQMALFQPGCLVKSDARLGKLPAWASEEARRFPRQLCQLSWVNAVDAWRVRSGGESAPLCGFLLSGASRVARIQASDSPVASATAQIWPCNRQALVAPSFFRPRPTTL